MRLGSRTGCQASRSIELVPKLIDRDLHLPKDFAQERRGDVAPRMVWHRRRSTIRVSEENVAPLLPHGLKAQPL
jgi:hypothetical protein